MVFFKHNREEEGFIPKEGDARQFRRRIWTFSVFLALLFLLIVGRLFSLQVLQTESYTSDANNNRLRIVSQAAKRGDIYDANGLPMAVSKSVFAIAIASSELKSSDMDVLCTNLAALINEEDITAESIAEAVKSNARNYEPVIVKRYSYDEHIDLLTAIAENKEKLPGVYIINEPQRYYPFGQVAGHILGTVGLISADEEDLIDEYNYNINDWIGKTGLEKTMERFTNALGDEIGLRGTRGYEKIEVNSKHQAVRVQETVDPIPGNSMRLTIDAGVQKVMEDSLASVIAETQKKYPKCHAGAAVLMNVKTGAVIAMASAPFMNPNDFANGLTGEMAEYYWDAELKPTFNRAVSGTYPPGSTFKPSTAIALVASGKLDMNYTTTCNAAAWIKPKAKCPYAHGRVDLTRAMAVSCNTYFQDAAAKVGIDELYPYYQMLGFGQQTGIELPSEAKGVLPNPEWKAANFTGWENSWRLYDTYYMSMGQGYNNDTPLQLCSSIATIANGGVRMQPYLVETIISAEDKVVYQHEPVVSADLGLTSEQVKLIQNAMGAVTSEGGTSYRLFADFPIEVAAKTGTAQTGLVGDNKDEDYHGLYVAYAPADDPQVAFACVIEYGYHGSTSAGYVARDVLAEYFGLNDVKQADLMQQRLEEEGL